MNDTRLSRVGRVGIESTCERGVGAGTQAAGELWR